MAQLIWNPSKGQFVVQKTPETRLLGMPYNPPQSTQGTTTTGGMQATSTPTGSTAWPTLPSYPQPKTFGGRREPAWQPQMATTGTTQQTGTTTGTVTGKQWWEQPSRARPEYKIPKDVARKYTEQEVRTGVRPLRRVLREAMLAAQSAPTGPLRGYLMQAALRGFSGGIGKVVQDAREYGLRLATEEARANWEADINAWLREWKQRRTQETTGTTTTTGTTAGVASEYGPPRKVPGVYNVGGPYKYYAEGGPINRQNSYMVGEEGIEMFASDSGRTELVGTQGPEIRTFPESGDVIPAPETAEIMSRQWGGPVSPDTGPRMMKRPDITPTPWSPSPGPMALPGVALTGQPDISRAISPRDFRGRRQWGGPVSPGPGIPPGLAPSRWAPTISRQGGGRVSSTRRFAPNPFSEQEELPITAGLGVQQTDPGMGGPEALGAFTAESPLYQEILKKQPGEVSDAQAQQWEEEKRIFNAPYEISSQLRRTAEYREKLIDKQFGGIDPNQRDSEKHAALERSAAKKQFQEILGRTPNTPEERLAEFNFTEKAAEKARLQKQTDIENLNNATSRFNTEQVVPKIKSIQADVAGLQEKHAALAEAKMGAAAEIEEARIEAGKPKKESDFKWAYGIWKENNPQGSPAEFRRKAWSKPSGGLTEASIVKSIDDLALTSDADPAKAYSNYLKYRKTMGREKAFNKVRQEMIETAELPEGLTEENIKFYETKHGMTREEVIRRVKAKQGQ